MIMVMRDEGGKKRSPSQNEFTKNFNEILLMTNISTAQVMSDVIDPFDPLIS